MDEFELLKEEEKARGEKIASEIAARAAKLAKQELKYAKYFVPEGSLVRPAQYWKGRIWMVRCGDSYKKNQKRVKDVP